MIAGLRGDLLPEGACTRPVPVSLGRVSGLAQRRLCVCDTADALTCEIDWPAWIITVPMSQRDIPTNHKKPQGYLTKQEPSLVDQNLFTLLSGIRAIDNPHRHVVCTILPAPEMKPGSIRISKGVGVIKNGDDYHTIISTLRDQLAIEVQDRTETESQNKVLTDITLEIVKQPTTLFYYAAPWFIRWLCESTITPASIRNKCRLILRRFLAQGPGLIYRGQNKRYRSVRSSLSRYWNTRSQEALRIMTKQYVTEARQRTSNARELPELDIQIAIQHLGGRTNLIDFSGLPWVALYFACSGEEDETGQLFALDVSRNRQEFKVHKGTDISYPVAKERAINQLGFLVEPVNGDLSGPQLKLMTETRPYEKLLFKNWLERIGITRQSLFADLMAYVEDEQESIPSEAFVHILSDWLRVGEYHRVYLATHGRIAFLESKNDEIGLRMSLYYRGLANAFCGRLSAALLDLNKAEELFTRGVPEVLKKNKRIIEVAAKNRSRRRVMGRRSASKLSLAIHESFYSEKIEGFTFVSG